MDIISDMLSADINDIVKSI